MNEECLGNKHMYIENIFKGHCIVDLFTETLTRGRELVL